MGVGNKKGQIYNTTHKSSDLKSYTRLSRALTKAKNQEPLGGRICKRRYDCIHYAGMLSAGALFDIPRYYDCPKDCKMYKKRDRHYQPTP